MNLLANKHEWLPFAVCLTLTSVASLASAPAAPSTGQVTLAPHRAVYDLKLSKSRGTRGVEAARGRILYDFSGNACEGYRLQFRQVSELALAGGKVTLSDMRSTTWEDAAARQFRFNSQNLLNDRTTDAVDGHAERNADAVKVSLVKPRAKRFSLPTQAVFPTEHMRRIILAAREGRTLLEFPVYDGTETGDKIYNTLTVIGHPIAPGEKRPADASGGTSALANLTRWPVTISYFDAKDTETRQSGEQVPVYSVSFELYENGVSRALILDYSDFTIAGKMTSLDMKKTTPCP